VDDLDGVRRGDPEERERWVAAWWPRVYRMALAMTGREADAEDLAQETMMAGLAAVDRFRGESSESTWLYSILLRKHLSRLRRPAPPVRRPSPLREPEVDGALALLADLPPAQKITATLFYVEDLSVKDIARALGVTVATVKWRLFRVRRTLRRRLGSDPSRIVCKELL
jgi:RNA polymerase sigma-70 factor (ECF subfamily)